MPEYLAPGVYVEETGPRARSIEGVATTTCAFVGPTRSGPVAGDLTGTPELLTSVAEFERIYGGPADLQFGDRATPNYLAHAVRAFFAEGGSRLYVARVIAAAGSGRDRDATTASVTLVDGGADDAVVLHARFPGAAGNGTATVIETAAAASRAMIDAAPPGTWLRTGSDEAPHDHLRIDGRWFLAGAPDAAPVDAEVLATARPRVLSLTVSHRDADGREQAWTGLGYDRRHPRWIGAAFSPTPARRIDQLQHSLALQVGARVDAMALRSALLADATPDPQAQPHRAWTLSGGSDGPVPQAADYDAALAATDALDDVATLAAPGAVALGDADNATDVLQALVDHASRARAWRLAVLDSPPGLTIDGVRDLRRRLDSKHAALYYPWVVTANPAAVHGAGGIAAELVQPPSAFVCGIYARNDVERGVHKAPANEVVRSALRFDVQVNAAQQEVLNPEGVNCLRTLAGRGNRVWGARTMSSDPEWKYVSVRRYFNYLEASIDRGTRWVVFEPNGEPLWASLRQAIGDFLNNEWRNGALLGSKPEQAYFVRCDRSTMTQDDIDQGRVVCMVGVATVRPAEFVVFRIAQQAAAA